MAVKPLPPLYVLKELFLYDEQQDSLIYRPRPRDKFLRPGDFLSWNSRFAGKEAGSHTKLGYSCICINSKLYFAHRIIWKMTTGEEPPPEIDHRNREPKVNQRENLRAATRSQNMGNIAKHKDNRSGFKGVTRHGSGYRATIRASGITRRLGTFRRPEDAYAAYCAAAHLYFGEFWHA